MPEVNLVVTTIEGRNEVMVPEEILGATGSAPSRQLLSFLRESEIPVPTDGMLTRTGSGVTFHEVPKFG